MIEMTDWKRVAPKWQYWKKQEIATLFCDNAGCDWHYEVMAISSDLSYLLSIAKATKHQNECEFKTVKVIEPKKSVRKKSKAVAAKKPTKKASKK